MILVTLGTQDKSFVRLLEAIDKQCNKKNIKEKVIVQAGYTKYESKNMEIFDLVSPKKLEEYMKEASIIITHGGVGSILTALKFNKKVIAAPRLSKYFEHTNDHQVQIIDEFEKLGYILALKDFSKLDKILESSRKFIPKKYKSNNKAFVELIDNYIKSTNNISWWNRYKKFLLLILSLLFVIILIYFCRNLW